MKLSKKRSYILYGILWTTVIGILSLFFSIGNERLTTLIKVKSIPFVLSICLFYVNLIFLMPKVLKKQLSLLFYIVILIISLLVILRIEMAVFGMVIEIDQIQIGSRPFRFLPLPYLLISILLFGLLIVLSSLQVLSNDRLKEKEIKQQIEFEKVTAELEVLKLQISPHFLFNTLNNIRWLARQKSDETEKVILKLSELLRYMIYQTSDEKVSLEQEILHLRDFIELQKMRLVRPDMVSFKISGDIQGKLIEPLLFIPLVENAFKFGFNEQYLSDISFHLSVDARSITFESENGIALENNSTLKKDSGLGLHNVRKRLELKYPNLYNFTTSQQNGKYMVRLTIHNS